MSDNRREALEALRDKVRAGAFAAPEGSERAPYFNRFMYAAEQCLPQDVRGCCVLAWEAYNGSLDRAMMLHNALLPEWFWCRHVDGAFYLEQSFFQAGKPCLAVSENCTNPARAWLLSILSALISETPKGETP